MPLPKPGENETREEFIARCVIDETVRGEFDTQDQRLAVCFSQWEQRGRAGGKDMPEEPDKDKDKDLFVTPSGKIIERGVRRELLCQSPNVYGTPVMGKKEGDTGVIEAYGAIFDNIDLGDEVIRKGTFAQSGQERIPTGRVKLMSKHFRDGGDVPELVGTVSEGGEDTTGFRFKALVAPTDLAQDCRLLACTGHVDTFSVGFGPLDWGWKTIDEREIVEHTLAKLYEFTMTVFPMNELCTLISAKSLDRVESRLQSFNTGADSLEPGALAEARVALIQDMIGEGEDALPRAKRMRDAINYLIGQAEPGDRETHSLDASRRRIEATGRRLAVHGIR